jgi:hypothetical protein
MIMPRTDIHRPSAEGFDPAEYALLGVFDLHPEDGTMIARRRVVARMVTQGVTFAGVHPTGQCDHCGAHIRYEALMIHNPTRKMITVGEQCLGERFAYATAGDFAAMRAEARRKAEETREAHRRGEVRRAALAWLADANPIMVELTYVGNGGSVDQSDFLRDLARKLDQYGDLSERQEAAAVKVITGIAARIQRDAERAAVEAARQATATPAPTGRVEVTGQVLRTWSRESEYGTQYKFRVITDAGYVVISTIPKAVINTLQDELGDRINVWARTEDLKDRRVRFTATLEPTPDDVTAAFASRPSKAVLIKS